MNHLAHRCELIVDESRDLSAGQSTLPADCADFGRLARLYRWMEWASFGPWLQRCRCSWLADMAGCRRALVFGDGDGRFTARLLRASPEIELDAVDASREMLAALLRHAGRDAARVKTHAADARLWQPCGTNYDLVVSHFFLDCLTTEEVRPLAFAVRGALSPGAAWAISEFAIPENGFGRWLARPLIAALYRAFGLLTGLRVRRLPDYAGALSEAGFERIKCCQWLGGLLTSELWSAAPNEEGEPGNGERKREPAFRRPVR